MPEALQRFLSNRGKRVVSFIGYSAAGYQDRAGLERVLSRVLARFDPGTVLVNAGATAVGIGAVYALARQRGFETCGIVSSQAREHGVELSPDCQKVFFIDDRLWGGWDPSRQALSPTSQAMIDVTSHLVCVGGGEVARDELLAALERGIEVEFIPAERDHGIALEAAAKAGRPPPTDFNGPAFAAFHKLK